jgi:pimeloyl-ACP methyl ester carboxylesterase
VVVLPYDEQGLGEPVLFLHAGVADRSMWRDHVGWLAERGFRAIAVDLPGFGEAPIAADAQAPWEDVLQAVRELDVAPVALVGNSFGAAVALRVAAIAPSAVASLLLVSPPPLDLEPSPTLSAAWEAEEAALERGDIDGAVNAVLDAWLQPQAPEALRARVGSMQRRAFELQGAAPEAKEAPDPLEQYPEALERLQMPVLAAAGEADMPDFKTGAEEIAELVPHGRLVIIAGAGHLAPLEAPDEFRELLLSFLRSAA